MTSVKRNGKRITSAAFAALIILLLTPAAARAQWTTTGNDVSNTNTGNVGVGTGASAPAAKLDVRGSIALDGSVPASHVSNYSALWLKNNVSLIPETASGYSILNVGTNYQRTSAGWTSVSQSIPTWVLSMGGGPTWDQFQLTRSSGGTYNPVKLLVVTSAGNVGVGMGAVTATPANALHVNSDFGPQAMRVSGVGGGIVNFVDASAGSNQKLYQWRSEGGLFRMSLSNDSELSLAQQNILVANSSGNLGVGTAAPGTYQSGLSLGAGPKVFHVKNASDHALLILSAGGAGKMPLIDMETADAAAGKRLLRFYYDGAGNAAKFRFVSEVSGSTAQDNVLVMKNDGSVGIGTAGPAARLDVSGGHLHVSGVCGGAMPNTQGAYLSWNRTCGTGETDLINHQGTGTGGFAFMNTANGSALTTLMSISGEGDLTVNGNISAKYQDVAEWVPSTQKLAAGTVVVLDKNETNHVLASTRAYDTKVAGVVSAEPGVILGVGGEDKLKVATTGRVKVKVDATRSPIEVGDLLVTGEAEGVAMKSVEVDLGGVKMHRPGTIIGKALEPLAKGTGEILVLLSLQ